MHLKSKKIKEKHYLFLILKYLLSFQSLSLDAKKVIKYI